MLKLTGLSFREYLKFEGVADVDPIPLGTLLKEHVRIARVLRDKFPVLRHFEAYRDGGPTLTQVWMETAKDEEYKKVFYRIDAGGDGVMTTVGYIFTSCLRRAMETASVRLAALSLAQITAMCLLTVMGEMPN